MSNDIIVQRARMHFEIVVLKVGRYAHIQPAALRAKGVSRCVDITIAEVSLSQVYLGQITLMANTYAPRGWHVCDGSLLRIAQYNALYALLGTNFGGDGAQTFGIPDLRSRVPVCAGSGPGLSTYALGQMGGTETMTLTAQNVAPHTHTGTLQVTGTIPGRGGNTVPPASGNDLYTTTTIDPSLGPTLVPLAGVTVNPNSGGTPFSILQPYTAVNFYIALQGLYPSRN